MNDRIKLVQMKSSFVESGRARFEQTDEYKAKVNEIKKEVLTQFMDLRKNEPSFLKRIKLYFKYKRELRLKLKKLSSIENLY